MAEPVIGRPLLRVLQRVIRLGYFL
jgi:hypothetical protein